MNEIIQFWRTGIDSLSAIDLLFLIFKVTLVWIVAILAVRGLRNHTAAVRHGILVAATITNLLIFAGHWSTNSALVTGWAVPGSQWVAATTDTNLASAAADSLYESGLPRNSATTPLAQLDDSTSSLAGQNRVDNDQHQPGLLNQAASRSAETGVDTVDKAPDDSGPEQRGFVGVPLATRAGDQASGGVSGKPTISWPAILLAVWLAGTILLLLRIGLAWVLVASKVGAASQIDEDTEPGFQTGAAGDLVRQLAAQGIAVRIGDGDTSGPLGAGLFRKRVLLPPGCRLWNDHQWRCVLLHEQAHFARRDCWIHLLANLVVALFWFHPLAWFVSGRIRVLSEMACDERVVRAGVPATDYAETLLAVARRARFPCYPPVASVAMAGSRDLQWRLDKLLTLAATGKSIHPAGWLGLATMAGLAGSALSTATIGSSPVSIAQQPAVDGPVVSSIIGESESRGSVADPQTGGTESQGTGAVPPVVDDRLDLKFIVKRRNGTELLGRPDLDQALNLVTRFGQAEIRPENIRSIVAAGDDDLEHAITIDDGTQIQGQLQGSFLRLENDDQSWTQVPWRDLASASAVATAGLRPGKITQGLARNQLTWHVRAPVNYDPARRYPALVVFHGPDSNSRDYLLTIADQWPDLADRYLLVGINGEKISGEATAESPKFNYTYINFAGNSKYTGYPGTDRESPALVAEAIQEIRELIPVSKIFVGGHSNGAFLTYSVLMNYPGLVDGAFPIAGGMLIQCVPEAYDDAELQRQQRATPIAVVHARNDATVDFAYSETAWRSYLDSGFPMVGLFDKFPGGHDFSKLPLPAVIDWLEQMTLDEPRLVLDRAEAWLQAGKTRDAIALLVRFDEQSLEESERSQLEKVWTQVRAGAAWWPDTDWLAAAASGDAAQEPGGQLNQVRQFMEFRREYEFAPAAAEVMEAFYALREQQEPDAENAWQQARELERIGQDAEALELYRTIARQFFASTRYAQASEKVDAATD